ncbi:hypothetical protein [Pedobacter ginsengisoli]|uniref:hypothetical protein n=1 Tax=Pedobacter ginsengisoli TaxID=363852 RepID=UPI0025509CDC|nr:hypothetical protein [Pedobacter ginsengisoli]
MRVAIVFFLSLCLFVLKGHGDVYGSTPRLEKLQHIKPEHAGPGLKLSKNNGLTEKKEDLIGIEDDEDLASSRKYMPPVICFIILASISLYCYSFLKSSLPFCWHLSYTSSYKYILQRVLRI